MAKNTLLINVDIGETRVGLIADGVLRELYVERRHHRSPVGNIYLGRVTRVLPGMQAAFIDIGLDRAAFLHVEDLQAEPGTEEEAEGDDKRGASKGRRNRVSRKTPIRDLLNEGQQLMVQVSKGPIGTKGARVTSHVALPGRYVVFMPTVDHVGVSKRIGNDRERRRLKEAIDSVKPPEGGVVVRTLAQGLTKKKLKADIGYLVQLWEQTQTARDAVKKTPALVHEEPDLVIQSARDLFTEDVSEIVVDDRDEFQRLKEFLTLFLPERADDVRLYEGYEPLFDEYGIEEEITRALSRKVQLPSGGHLVIDQAEALTAIDVNTGRFTGKGRRRRADDPANQSRGGARDRVPAPVPKHRRPDRARLHRHGAARPSGKGVQGAPRCTQERQVEDDRDSNQRVGPGRDDSEADPTIAGANALRAVLFLRRDRAPSVEGNGVPRDLPADAARAGLPSRLQDHHQRASGGLRHARTGRKGVRGRSGSTLSTAYRNEAAKRLSSGAVRPDGRLTFR